MDSEKSETAMRSPRELVIDDSLREKQGLILAVHASCQVDVLGIHEKVFVEQTYLLQGLGIEKHEASRQIGRIDAVGIIGMAQLEGGVPLVEQSFRQAKTRKHIEIFLVLILL